MESFSRTNYLKLSLLLLHLVAFDVWWVVGPYGPIQGWRAYRATVEQTRKQGLEPCRTCGRPAAAVTYSDASKSWTLFYCVAHTNKKTPEAPGGMRIFDMVFLIILGSVGLVGAIEMQAKKFLRWPEAKSQDPGDEKFSVGLIVFCVLVNLLFFWMSTFSGMPVQGYVDYTVLAAGGSVPHFQSVPIVERFLSLQELVAVAVAIGAVIFYSSFYVRRGRLFVMGSHRGLAQTVTINIVVYLLYLVAVLAISFVAAAVGQAIARLLLLVLDAMGMSAADEVRREYGQGLSRSVPYAVLFTAFAIGIVLFGIYSLLIYPYKLSSYVLDYLQAKFGETHGGTRHGR